MWAAWLMDWLVDIMGNETKSTERVREWRKKNQERKRELDRKAKNAYLERKKQQDPEFTKKVNEYQARKKRERYVPTSELTPEELEKRRAEIREAVRRSREKKRLQEAMLKVQRGE